MILKDKVAVITGGGTGIGKATAQLFAQEGAKIVLAGRRRDPLAAAATTITESGGKAEVVLTDISSPSQVQNLFNRVVSIFGRIDILFNNAGVFTSGKMAHDFDEDEWERTININLFGTIYCSKYVVPHLLQGGGGVIINCSSVSGWVPQRLQAPYNVSKAAIEMLSKCMCLELGPSNIRVNSICPNLTETDMAAGAIAVNGREKYELAIPLRRIGQPIDIANAALFLASHRSNWVSGNSLFVDGGSCPR
jgi:NAD(P)-dependent dehydrogenase (short-subunit alcohol dehydrogenase family)